MFGSIEMYVQRQLTEKHMEICYLEYIGLYLGWNEGIR